MSCAGRIRQGWLSAVWRIEMTPNEEKELVEEMGGD